MKVIDLTGKSFGKLLVLNREFTDIKGPGAWWNCQCSCGNIKVFRSASLLLTDTKSCGCFILSPIKQGDTFTRLTVISDRIVDNKRSKWKCLCSCGKELFVRGEALLSGHTKSCGCLNKELSSSAHLKSLVGQVFTRLTVVKRILNATSREVKYLCSCSCGNSLEVLGSSLKTDNTRSCGCLSTENKRTTSISYNRAYRISLGENPDIPLSISRGHFRKQFQESDIRAKIIIRDNFKCILCSSNKNLHIHHIVPLSVDYTKNMNLSNLIALCQNCHTTIAHPKKNMYLIDLSYQRLFQSYTTFYS